MEAGGVVEDVVEVQVEQSDTCGRKRDVFVYFRGLTGAVGLNDDSKFVSEHLSNKTRCVSSQFGRGETLTGSPQSSLLHFDILNT